MTTFREGKWDRDRALGFLKSVGVMPIDKVIELSANEAPGLTAWGAIDYLRNYCGYSVRRDGSESEDRNQKQ